MFCMYCGSKIPDGAKFCPECGALLEVKQPIPPEQPQQQPYEQPRQQQYEQPRQQPYEQPRYQPYEQPRQQPYEQPRYQQYEQPRQQSYEQPRQQPYEQPQDQQYEQPQRGRERKGTKSRKRRGFLAKFTIRERIMAVILAVVLVVVGISWPRGGNSAVGRFESLCSMIGLNTETYLNARMLTEKILRTDVTKMEPTEMKKLLQGARSAWKDVESLSKKVLDLSDTVSRDEEKGRLKDYGKTARGGNLLTHTAYAAGEGDMTPATQMLTTRESITRCMELSQQLENDAAVCGTLIQKYEALYRGTSTATGEWGEISQTIESSFKTMVFFYGDFTSDENDLGTGSRSIFTMTRGVKAGSALFQDTSVLVNVSSEGSTLVLGPSGIAVDQADIAAHLPENSDVMTISSHVGESGNRDITFHPGSLASWFVLEQVVSFTMTRGNKGENTSSVEIFPDPELTDNTSINDDFGEANGSNNPNLSDIIPPRWSGPCEEGIRVDSPDVTPPTIQVQDVSPESVGTVSDRVNAGTGDITVTMIWASIDDLDLHMETPDGSHIFYSNKVDGGGILDVDRQASTSNLVSDPIENIYFSAPEAGHYKVWLENYKDRTEGQSVKYVVRVTIDGREEYYSGTLQDGVNRLDICEFDYGGSSHQPPAVNETVLGEALSGLNAGTGPITVSMLWNTTDDVDLHMNLPAGGHIYYGNKRVGGGELDIDANANGNMMESPVENIYFEAPSAGHYKVYINMFNDRTGNSSAHYLVKVTVGDRSQVFEGEIDGTGSEIPIVEFDYEGGAGDATDENTNASIPTSAGTFNGHRYEFYSDMLSWSEADVFCRSMGGHLVTITSEEEQSYLQSRFPNSLAFIGGRRSGSGWTWVTGENWSYEHWASGEPNNQGGSEDCLQFYNEMNWNDIPNGDQSYHRGFICEWESEDGRDLVAEIPPVQATESPTLEDLNTALDSAGAQSGDITVSMVWNTEDDLDLHVITPDNSEIYFNRTSAQGGELDVDANANGNLMEHPVENIYFANPEAGHYKVFIRKYRDRINGASDYLVRVRIGEQEQVYSGTIQNEDDEIVICEFDYAGNPNAQAADTPEETVLDTREETAPETVGETELDRALDNAGAQSGPVTISVTWDSDDDLDLHVMTPDGSEIYHDNRVAGGGVLDVDANSDENDLSSQPVENVYFSDPPVGSYYVGMYNYKDRTPARATNYYVRVESGGQAETFSGTLDEDDDSATICGFQYNGDGNG